MFLEPITLLGKASKEKGICELERIIKTYMDKKKRG